jgi:hypothetical protein
MNKLPDSGEFQGVQTGDTVYIASARVRSINMGNPQWRYRKAVVTKRTPKKIEADMNSFDLDGRRIEVGGGWHSYRIKLVSEIPTTPRPPAQEAAE